MQSRLFLTAATPWTEESFPIAKLDSAESTRHEHLAEAIQYR
jgi:hypothetical protein